MRASNSWSDLALKIRNENLTQTKHNQEIMKFRNLAVIQSRPAFLWTTPLGRNHEGSFPPRTEVFSRYSGEVGTNRCVFVTGHPASSLVTVNKKVISNELKDARGHVNILLPRFVRSTESSTKIQWSLFIGIKLWQRRSSSAFCTCREYVGVMT